MAVSILVRLPQDTVKTLEELASATKQPRNVLIRKALEAYLTECADHQVALDRLRDREDPVIPAGEFQKHLGRKKHRKDATSRRRGPLNRTPILADEETLRALRRIARERGLSLAECKVVARLFAQAASPEERGFGMWKGKSSKSVRYVNALRDAERRSPLEFLADDLASESE